MSATSTPLTGQSVLRKARSVLRANGIPIGKITGRYYPIGNGQRVTEGWNASRVGCSDQVALMWHGDRASRAIPLSAVVAAMRVAGLPFDDRGWLTTGGF